jgi:hypothetical protein
MTAVGLGRVAVSRRVLRAGYNFEVRRVDTVAMLAQVVKLTSRQTRTRREHVDDPVSAPRSALVPSRTVPGCEA